MQDTIVSTLKERTDALDNMVLSASGWRAVFGSHENDTRNVIPLALRDLSILAAAVFLEHVNSAGGTVLTLGTDTRPTGPAVIDAILPVFTNAGLSVQYLGQVPSPEIMAYVKEEPGVHGFVYVSASHNPPGHNGFKFGDSTGRVLDRSTILPMISRFRELATNQDFLIELLNRIHDSDGGGKARGIDESIRSISKQRYRDFVLRTASASRDISSSNDFLSDFRKRLLARPIGVVAEMNGSARSVGIDSRFLAEVGFRVSTHNDTPGCFVHDILPEGKSLDTAAQLLSRVREIDPIYQLAYVPDNDGDRGNVVFFDGEPILLEAQDLFALAVASELAWVDHLGELVRGKHAVVVNGPTSLRIDRVATAFGVEIHRAEVGEANVVSLAEELRSRGYRVRILGEGSNGGNITEPSTVRDPMSTLLCLGKLWGYDLFSTIAGRLGKVDSYREGASFAEIVRTLPQFTTTPSGEDRAKMTIITENHGVLKRKYEELVSERIGNALKLLTPHFGELTWRETNLEGKTEKTGSGPAFRSGSENGGLRLVFSTADRDVAALWMRGSGTERVFRVLADVEGDRDSLERNLLEWHRTLVGDADRS